MKNKWVKHFRKAWKKADINTDQYSDEEILDIAKGFLAPNLCKQIGMTEHWQFELYWRSLMCLDPDPFMENGIDLDLFKNRANENQN